MQYIQHGTLAVPQSIETQYEQAKAYLCHDSGEARLFSRLEHAKDGRHFRICANSRNDDYFDPNDSTIGWDPYSALRTTRGGNQSPALGLGHEVDHAVENPRIAGQLRDHALARYDDAEERRVIRGSETHAARVLGEDVRHDHRGSTYRVAGPTLR